MLESHMMFCENEQKLQFSPMMKFNRKMFLRKWLQKSKHYIIFLNKLLEIRS